MGSPWGRTGAEAQAQPDSLTLELCSVLSPATVTLPSHPQAQPCCLSEPGGPGCRPEVKGSLWLAHPLGSLVLRLQQRL